MRKLSEHDITLQSGRIVLRPMTEDDWDILLKWNSDAEVLYFSEGADVASRPLDEVQGIYRGVSQNALCFIIEFDGSPIGEGWLQRMNMRHLIDQFPGRDLRRIDLVIGEKQFWDRGIGTEVIRMLTEFGFEKEKADAVFGIVHGHNPRSRRAFEKNGYTLHAEVSEPGPKSDVSWDLILTRKAFEKLREKSEK